MKKTSLFAIVAIALTLSLAESNARAATILASADFNDAAAGHTANFNVPAGDYANGALLTQPASAPAASQWQNTNSTVNPLTVSGNTGTAAGNGLVTLTTSGEDDRLPFASSINGSSAYLSADINLSAAQTGDYFLHLGDGGTSIFALRLYAKATTGGYLLALLTNGSTAPTAGQYGTTVIPFNTSEHIVAVYNFVAGAGNDTSALYLNPTDPVFGGDNLYVNGAPGTATSDVSSLGAVYLRQGSATAAASGTVDNVLVVPEPTTLVLAGLGFFGLVGVARRKLA